MTDRDIVKIAKALSDPTRLGILRAVASREELCCGDVARRCPVTAATVSHHLRVLAEAGLVETRRDGQFVHVRLARDRVRAYQEALSVLAVASLGPLGQTGTDRAAATAR